VHSAGGLERVQRSCGLRVVNEVELRPHITYVIGVLHASGIAYSYTARIG
jgi:hypothetical protein